MSWKVIECLNWKLISLCSAAKRLIEYEFQNDQTFIWKLFLIELSFKSDQISVWSSLPKWIIFEKWSNFGLSVTFPLNLDWKQVTFCSGAFCQWNRNWSMHTVCLGTDILIESDQPTDRPTECRPIPQQQINQSPILLENPGIAYWRSGHSKVH